MYLPTYKKIKMIKNELMNNSSTVEIFNKIVTHCTFYNKNKVSKILYSIFTSKLDIFPD